MSKIVIVADSSPSAEVLGSLHSAMGASPLEIKRVMAQGLPLIERRLFGNTHPEAARVLHAVADALQRAGIEADYFEIEPDEDFQAAPWDDCRISAETMKAIIDDWEP